MSVVLIVGGAAIFAAGLGVGAAATLALARDKIAAMTAAAERANAVITTHSEDALKELAEAHASAQAMIGAIETAKASTARAETSVTGLISKIHASRESLDEVARLQWFQTALLSRRGAAPRLVPVHEEPPFG